MTFDEYIILAQRTASTKTAQEKRENGLLGLIGETGEVADALKKQLFQGRPEELTVGKMVDELGDVLWYCAELVSGERMHGVKMPNEVDSRIMAMDKSNCPNYRTISLKDMVLVLAKNAATVVYLYPDVSKIVYLVACIAQRIGSSLEDVMQHNIEKLRQRYPDGFDADRSNKRYE